MILSCMLFGTPATMVTANCPSYLYRVKRNDSERINNSAMTPLMASSRSTSLDSIPTALVCNIKPVAEKRQRSFTTVVRCLASKLAISNSRGAQTETLSTGPLAEFGPRTWEKALDAALEKYAAYAIADYDDAGALPTELIALMRMRPSYPADANDEKEKGVTEVANINDEWVEL